MIRSFTQLLTLAFACLSLFAAAAVAQDYKLRAGDTIRIEVLEDQTINRSLLIAPDGRVSLPLAGVVSAAGRSIESLQTEIAARLGPNFASPPTVYVALEKQKDPRPATGGVAAAPVGTGVYILGEAGKPGRLEVKPGTTMLQLFSQMGGFTKFAATKRIQLRRGNQTYLFNYNAIEAGTSNAGSTTVSDGDVIVVPQRKLFE